MFCQGCGTENENTALFCRQCGRALTRTKPEVTALAEAPEGELAPGTGIDRGRYRVERVLGAGGMGTVYLAWDNEVERRVVVKFPHPSLMQSPDFANRFAEEIRAQTRMSHRGVVHVYGRGSENGLPFFVVQYMGGGSLGDRLDPQRPMSVDELRAWLPSVAETLDFLHEQGVVHRDIKPDNILFDEHGHAYLSDFGIAKVISETRMEAGAETRTGMFVGTPAYLAPEYVDRVFSPACDQYSLAVLVYRALSGRFPHEAPTHERLLIEKATRDPEPLHQHAPHLSAAVSDAVMRALARDPERRYPSCRAFARAVQDAAGAGTGPVLPGSEAETVIAPARADAPGRATRRSPVSQPAVLGGVALVALLAGAFYLLRSDGVEVPESLDPALREAARAAVQEVEAARTAAREAGAERSAAEALARGDELLAGARFALGDDRAEEAVGILDEARLAFEAADAAAQAALRDAETSRAAVVADAGERGVDDCTTVSEATRGSCERGLTALEAAAAAIARKDAPGARERIDEAARALQQVRLPEPERAAPAPRPARPPEILARTPAGAGVEAHKGEKVALSVEARDPDGDLLRYEWRRDGRVFERGSPRVELFPKADTEVEVAVSDGTSRPVESAWRIRVRNRPPSVQVTPAEATLRVALGEELELRARASDPDGDDTDVAFLLDGERVSTRSRWTFEAEAPGRHRLTVQVEDEDGAVGSTTRTLVVPEPPPPPAPEPVEVAAVQDPAAAARAVMAEYERAYEARDVDRLAAVWRLGDKRESALRRFFDDVDRVSVELDIRGVAPLGGSVRVDFDQRIEASGMPDATRSMRATVVQDGGRWIIDALETR